MKQNKTGGLNICDHEDHKESQIKIMHNEMCRLKTSNSENNGVPQTKMMHSQIRG